MNNPPLLKVKDLEIHYITQTDILPAVKKVSFDIHPGEVLGLAGESGCGKSTVAFAISRLTNLPGVITGGEILFEGRDILKLEKEALRQYRWAETSVVFQSAMDSLNPVISIEEQICDAILAHQPLTKQEAHERAVELMELVDLDPTRLHEFPHQFSGGMRQRIGIALALALQPKLIIMDEPTTALDVVVQRDIIERIYKLKEQFNFSVLFISHDLSMMAEFADRIAVMKEGEIVEIGKAREIWTNPQHEYTQILGKAFLSLDSAQIDTNLFKIEDAQVQEDAVLELKNVRKSFKTRKSLFKTENFDALNNINFKLKKGRALALVGESGSGKSTCAKLLSKVYPQTEGDILYHGNNIKDLKSKEQLRAYQKSVQMIFQDPFGSLNPTLTIGYHIARPLQIHRGIKDPKKLNEEIIKILDWVELSPASEMMNRYPHELSGGQRQRVAIARVLAMEPEVILADEPTSMLDVSLRVGVLDLLQKLKDELKISFLYITHDIATAKYFAEDIAVLYRGEIVEWGTSKQVTENPQHPYTRLLLNSIPDPKISIAERVASGKDPIRQIWDPQGKGCTFAQECSCGKGECAHTQSPIVQVNSEHFIREFHYTKAS